MVGHASSRPVSIRIPYNVNNCRSETIHVFVRTCGTHVHLCTGQLQYVHMCVYIYNIERERKRETYVQRYIYSLSMLQQNTGNTHFLTDPSTENTAKRASLRSSSLGNGTPVSSVEVTWPTGGSEGMEMCIL